MSPFIFSHVLPPSGERYRPLGRVWGFFVASFTVFGIVSASTIVYMTSGLDSEMAILMRPFSCVGKPFPSTLVHVAPASVLFQSAEPGPPDWRK